MERNTGANWQIVVDGRPRSYRDDPDIARAAARYLKVKSPNSDVSVRNIVTGETLSIAVEQASVAWVDRPGR